MQTKDSERMPKTVTILIPCYNEQDSLPITYEALLQVINRLPQYEWQVLLVNDGSSDGTLQLMRRMRENDARVNYISMSRNFGKENAMLAGFDHARGDCMLIMDADMQHPPTLIPQMLEKWEQGWQDVYAHRLSRGRESIARRLVTSIYYKLLKRMSQSNTMPNVGDFRLLDRCCIDALRQMREGQRYTKGMYGWIGFRKTSVDFEQGDRVAGQSAFSYASLFRLAADGITSFSTWPLRFSAIIGVIISLTAFIYMVYVLVRTLAYGDPVPGYPTLIIVILFMGGVQLLSLGIIGEYVGKIFHETKHRPVYLIDEKEGC